MKTVALKDAQARLPELAREVEAGETIVVMEDGAPVFDMTPHDAPLRGVNFAELERLKKKWAWTRYFPMSHLISTILCPKIFSFARFPDRGRPSGFEYRHSAHRTE